MKIQWVNRDNLVKTGPVLAASRRSQPPLLVLSGTILPKLQFLAGLPGALGGRCWFHLRLRQ